MSKKGVADLQQATAQAKEPAAAQAKEPAKKPAATKETVSPAANKKEPAAAQAKEPAKEPAATKETAPAANKKEPATEKVNEDEVNKIIEKFIDGNLTEEQKEKEKHDLAQQLFV